MFFGIIGIVGMIVFGILFFVSLISRNGKAKRNAKLIGYSVVMFGIGLSIPSPPSDTAEPAKEEKKELTAEAEAKVEAENKTIEEARIKKVKEAFLKEIKPELNNHTKVYDDNWNNVWKPTMDAIANGSTDYYTAYKNMQVILDNYEGGRMLSMDPVEGMTKEDKKLLNQYAENMRYAFTFRCMAVEVAQEGFNAGTMSPEQLNKLETNIQMADQSMIEAVSAITVLQQSYGITE